MDEQQFPPSTASGDGIMKHFFVLGEYGFAMSYKVLTGEWEIDRAEVQTFNYPYYTYIEYIEYLC